MITRTYERLLQFKLSEDIYQELLKESAQGNTSMANIIRKVLIEHFTKK
jgi:predicted CopG family antitoxin